MPPDDHVHFNGHEYGRKVEPISPHGIRFTPTHLTERSQNWPGRGIDPTSYAGNRLVESVNGHFSGGPLMFAVTFTVEDGLITLLWIVPA